MQWIVDAGGRIHLHIKVILAVVYGLTLYPMIETGYTMQDDVLLSLAYETKSLSHSPLLYLLKSAVDESIYFGRVWVIYGTLMSYVPFFVHSLVYFKIVAFTSLTINAVLYYFVLKRLFASRHLAFLGVVLLFAFLQNSLHHNLITSFVAHFMTGLSLLLASLLFFDLYLERPRRSYMLAAGFLYFLACFSYELFVLYFFLFFVLAVRRIMIDGKLTSPLQALRPAQLFRSLLPAAVPLAIYLVIYGAYRLYFPTQYTGIEIDFSPARYLDSVHRLTIGALPASLYFRHSYDSIFVLVTDTLTGHKSSLLYILSNARAEWLVRGGLLAFLLLMVLRDRPRQLKGLALLYVLCVCLLLFWIPGILPALSGRYQVLVEAGLPMYLVTTFSFYAFTTALAAAAIYINDTEMRPILRRGLHAAAVVCVFSLSILTDYSNFHVGKFQAQIHRKWLIMDDFLRTAEFASIPEGSVVYAPTLWQDSDLAPIVEVSSYWQNYVRALTKKQLMIVKKESEFKKLILSGELSARPVYFLKFSQERKYNNQFLVFAKLSNFDVQRDRPELRTNEAFLFTRSAYRNFTIFLQQVSDSPVNVVVDGAASVARGGFAAVPVNKLQDKSRLLKTHLQWHGLDPEGVTLSSFIEQTSFSYNEEPGLLHDMEDARRKIEEQRRKQQSAPERN